MQLRCTKATDYLDGNNSAVIPAGIGVLVKSIPADYIVTSGTGVITLIANPSVNGCTS